MRLHAGLHREDDFLTLPHDGHDYRLAMVNPQTHHSLHKSYPPMEPPGGPELREAPLWGRLHLPELFWGHRGERSPRAPPSPPATVSWRSRRAAPRLGQRFPPFSRILTRPGTPLYAADGPAGRSEIGRASC